LRYISEWQAELVLRLPTLGDKYDPDGHWPARPGLPHHKRDTKR